MASDSPMTRDELINRLRDSRALLDAFGVVRVALFGSYARDEATLDSDVDLLVEFGRPIGLFEFVRLQRELGGRLGRRVELVTAAALKPQLRDRILSEAVAVAEPEALIDSEERFGIASEDVRDGHQADVRGRAEKMIREETAETRGAAVARDRGV
jgi:predicted nucleotidyltransferase